MPVKDGPFFALDAHETKAMMDSGAILVVDVREPHEFEAGHMPGAVNMPLSRFEPSDLQSEDGKRIVLSCAAGMRSFRALEMATAAGADVDTHVGQGMKGWYAAGFPVEQGL